MKRLADFLLGDDPPAGGQCGFAFVHEVGNFVSRL